VDGAMVVAGEQKVVGDIGGRRAVGYEVLCRTHHRQRRAAQFAEAGAQ
jgi:thymidine kinase